MNNRIIWKNLARDKAVSLAAVLLITVSALLLSLSAILAVNLSGAIDRLMEEAMTPHFMQMHSGELDRLQLETFAEDHHMVKAYQTSEFLNVDSSQISMRGNSLAGSLQDNGFCIQNEEFDYLLDLNNQRIRAEKGELYVPVCYLLDGTAKEGDLAVIGGRQLRIAGFVRDSQMNASLASSKRFVVSTEDYLSLKPLGSVEYLIEFRLNDLSELRAFEAAYSAAGLPANGPTLTWPLFQMMSAVSDGIMIAVIMLISILVILIALLCIRFTLLAKIEDDYREIGVMKAIGMRNSEIQRIFFASYAAMAAIGSILGFLLSILFQGPMKKGIQLNLGSSSGSHVSLMLGAAGVTAVFLLVLLYVNGILRRFRKISAVQAIRFGVGREPGCGLRGISLSKNRVVSANLFLAVKDILTRKSLYFTMLVVIALASFIMIVPQNLYHTISSDDFITYLGVGQCDLRMDIQQTGQIDDKTAQIGSYMESDPDIRNYALLVTKIFHMKMEDGTVETLKIELGDHTVFPLEYVSGRSPLTDQEIALSSINADELNKEVGSRITILTGAGEKDLTVSGIFSDITNGGKTAKAVFTDPDAQTAWSVICAGLKDSRRLSGKLSEYGKRFEYAKLSSVEEYVAQTFGQTLGAVRTASWTAVLAAAAITVLVTLLFMRLLTAKDRYSIAVMKAIGFTCSDIRRQYAWRAVLVTTAGLVLGAVLAGTLGEQMAGAAISSFGAAAFHFHTNLISSYFILPLCMHLAALAAVVFGTAGVKEVHIYESIKE